MADHGLSDQIDRVIADLTPHAARLAGVIDAMAVDARGALRPLSDDDADEIDRGLIEETVAIFYGLSNINGVIRAIDFRLIHADDDARVEYQDRLLRLISPHSETIRLVAEGQTDGE